MIWPLLPTDAETLREGFRRLSRDSRRNRFLTALDELDDAMIRRLVDSVDGVQHIALLLVVLPSEGEEELAGVAHLVLSPDEPATAGSRIRGHVRRYPPNRSRPVSSARSGSSSSSRGLIARPASSRRL